jgi:hypothetical protein
MKQETDKQESARRLPLPGDIFEMSPYNTVLTADRFNLTETIVDGTSPAIQNVHRVVKGYLFKPGWQFSALLSTDGEFALVYTNHSHPGTSERRQKPYFMNDVVRGGLYALKGNIWELDQAWFEGPLQGTNLMPKESVVGLNTTVVDAGRKNWLGNEVAYVMTQTGVAFVRIKYEPVEAVVSRLLSEIEGIREKNERTLKPKLQKIDQLRSIIKDNPEPLI